VSEDRDELIDVVAKLVRGMNPVLGEDEVQLIATLAADAYLEHVDEVEPADRRELLEEVLDEVMESY
jgi:hypothetical protein